MLELLINPAKAERKPWEMLFVGFFYAALSMILTNLVFGADKALAKYSSIFVVMFLVICSMPFIYYLMRYEERKISQTRGMFRLLVEHQKSVIAFMFMFLGFLIGFTLVNSLMDSNELFRAQIETYCSINRPSSFMECTKQYGLSGTITGAVTAQEKLVNIFVNNFYVLVFTLILSVVLGAGAIFILAWNASVISAAMMIFIKSNDSNIFFSLFRYMIHGIPEIAAYFIAAIAGGIVSFSIIKKDATKDKILEIVQDAINLVLLALAVLFIAALIEVYITPAFY